MRTGIQLSLLFLAIPVGAIGLIWGLNRLFYSTYRPIPLRRKDLLLLMIKIEVIERKIDTLIAQMDKLK